MSDTRIFSFTDREEANQHILNRKSLKENVIEISSTDVIEFNKNGEVKEAWYSGFEDEWILVISTPENITSPGKPANET